MQHGIYVAEFEQVLLRHSFAISRNSLAQLISQVDFSKLRDEPQSDRQAFYEALFASIKPQGRGVENGIQILGENDSEEIIKAMSEKASRHLIPSSRVRDIWCRIFIGGCP